MTETVEKGSNTADEGELMQLFGPRLYMKETADLCLQWRSDARNELGHSGHADGGYEMRVFKSCLERANREMDAALSEVESAIEKANRIARARFAVIQGAERLAGEMLGRTLVSDPPVRVRTSLCKLVWSDPI